MSAPIIKLNPKRKTYDGFFGFVVLLAAATLVSFVVAGDKKQVEKKYKMELTATEWTFYYQNIILASNRIRHSNLPSGEVALIQDSILLKFVKEIEKQIPPQMEADKKVSDTTKVKPKN